MNTQNINNSNNESINGMSQVVIDLRPQVKHQDGHGREVLADVHFRIDVQAYVNNFYTYTKEAREESEKACEAYYSEVVELLKAEGWTLRKEKYGVGDCPQMVKGTQYLYCHPQDISGQVDPADIETLEAKIKALTTCKYYATDNYGDIIVTTSESDEKQLYRDTYADGLASIWQECTTTKRSNLYKDKAEAEHCVRRRICIANRRADLNDIGTGSYNMRTPLLQFLMEEYDRLLQAGYIKEATGQNGRTLCRWINKKEEKELTKARREAEKQAKADAEAKALQEAAEIAAAEGIEVGSFVKINTDGRTAIVTGIGLVSEGHGVILYLDDFTNWCQDCREKNGYNIIKTSDEVTPLTEDDYKPTDDIKDDYKPGDRVRHNQSGRVATIEGVRVTREMKVFGEYRKVYRLNFGEAVLGPFDTDLNGGEFLAEAITLYEASEIKPKAAFQIGDRVERKSDGERVTVDGYDVTDGKLTYIVKYDRTQRRESDGFEYLSEELNCDELQADSIESLTAKYAKQIEESALLGCGCMVGDGDETRKDSKCVKVRTAYKNDSHDAKDWTYCVSWYETTPVKGDADGQHQTLRECENGILLEQAARHMAYFELMARKGWTLDEILYGKAA